jgi:hypothetical protein
VFVLDIFLNFQFLLVFVIDRSVNENSALLIQEFIKSNKSIEELSLQRNWMGVVYSKPLARGLQLNCSLTCLELDNNDIEDEGKIESNGLIIVLCIY